MGQYWSGIIIKDEKPVVSLSPYVLHEGAKLMEEANFGSPYIKFWEKLLSEEFYGDNFIWCGDYSDGTLYADSKAIQGSCAERYSELIDKINSGKYVDKFRYLINITKLISEKYNKTSELGKKLINEASKWNLERHQNASSKISKSSDLHQITIEKRQFAFL